MSKETEYVIESAVMLAFIYFVGYELPWFYVPFVTFVILMMIWSLADPVEQ